MTRQQNNNDNIDDLLARDDEMDVDDVGTAAEAPATGATAAAVARPAAAATRRAVAPPGAPLMSECFFSWHALRARFDDLFASEKSRNEGRVSRRRLERKSNALLPIIGGTEENDNRRPLLLLLTLLSLHQTNPPPAIVLQHPQAVEAAAKEWADRYQARRAPATAELLTLLVSAAGGEIPVTAADVDEGDVDSLVQDLVSASQSHGLLDPFGSTAGRGAGAAARARAAREAYSQLWTEVVKEVASRGLLGDGYVIDKTIKLILGLTW